MGNLLQSLGLGGGPKLDPLAAARAGVIDERGAMGNPDVTVTGDGWQPRKPTILGAIADSYLMSQGMKPSFSMMRDQRSVTEAMEGMANDPMQAIRRLSRIPGMQDEAWKMLSQHKDDIRADTAQDRLIRDSDERYAEHVTKRIQNILGGVTLSNDPDAAYTTTLPVLRRMQQQAEERGVKLPYDLPDKYDPNTVKAVSLGNYDVDDQIKQEQLQIWREQNRLLRERKMANDQSYRTERLEDFDNAEEGRDRRAAAVRAARGKGGGKPKPIEQNGVKVGEVSPDGRFARIFKDGKWVVYDITLGMDKAVRMPDKGEN